MTREIAAAAMQVYGKRDTGPPVEMPAVGDVVRYLSVLQEAPLPAIVVGMASDPDQTVHGINIVVFYDGDRPSSFVRNVSHSPEAKGEARTWHWPDA